MIFFPRVQRACSTNHSTHSCAAHSCKTLFLLKCCSSENMHYPVFAQVLLITNMQYPVFAHVLLIVYFGEAWKGWFGWGHSITTWTRWGGSGSKNVCFCPRSGYKNSPQAICFVNSVCTPHNISKLARADISCQFKKTRYFRIVIITSWQKTIPYFVFDICIPSTRKPRICNKSKYWQ